MVLTGYRYGAQNIVNEYDGNRNILINESNSVNSNIQLWELTGSTYISFKSWSHGESVMSALIYAID